MDFQLTAEQCQLEQEVRAYLSKNVTDQLVREIDFDRLGRGPLHRKFIRQLGADGWLGIGWPKEYGGQGRSAIEQYIFFDLTKGYFEIPIPSIALNCIGPTLMRVGTEDQKQHFLPAILRGEMEIAVGYTEPEAGTDLASLQTRATRDGDDYVINGQKVFTTSAHFCDYIWLAARTDPEASKHRGISVFLVDAKTAGISYTPIHIMGGYRSNSTYYDNVRVPQSSLVGEENHGWRYMATQLALERIMLVAHSTPLRVLEDVTGWASETIVNGKPVIDEPWVSNELADMLVGTQVLKLLNFRLAWLLSQGTIVAHESAMIKFYGSEHLQRVLGSSLRIMGIYGQLNRDSERAPLQGRIERAFNNRVLLSFGGGANDILRELVAQTGLGMPKSR